MRHQRHAWFPLVAILGTATNACGTNATGNGIARPAVVLPARSSSASLLRAGAGRIYVSNYEHYSVAEFDINASGDARPIATIQGRRPNLFKPEYVALDDAGYAYVQDAPYDIRRYPVVSVFAPGASGDVAPVRTINPESHFDIHPFGIALDAAGYLYEADTDFASIEIFAPGASGDASPVRAIGGQRTTLHNPFAVAVDRGGRIYVTDGAPEVVAFAADASGDVSPIARLSGGRTLLNAPDGIAFDARGDLYISDANGTIDVFAPGANGNVAPIRRIVPAQRPQELGGIAEANGELFVTQVNAGTVEYSIGVYPEGADGVTPALRTIAGAHTGLDGLHGIAVR